MHVFESTSRVYLGTQKHLVLSLIGRRYTPEGPLELQDLETPFIEEEIKDAVFHLKSKKSLGPNGFSFVFYKRCWNIIKAHLIRVFNSLYNHQAALDN